MKYKLFIILLCFICVGCYNYRELNDLAITSGIGISKDNDNYKIIIQVIDQKEEPSFEILTTEGKTIQEALRNVMNESSKRLFINHMQVLIIDKELAKEGIKEIIDFFYRDPESRKQFNVLISNNVKDTLTTKTLLEKINSKNLKERIDKNTIFLNDINNLTFNNLLITYLNPYKELLISSIIIKDDKLLLDKSYIFKDDKLIGELSKEDVIYYNFINNKIDDTLLTFNIDNALLSIEVIHNNTLININNNNITINLNINATINDSNNNLDLTNNTNINLLESHIKNTLDNNIYNSINNTINSYNSDIYGFIDLIYKNEYKYFIKNKPKLDNLNIKINTNINLTHKGNGDNTI